MYVSIHILTQLTYFTSMWGLPRLVPNIINMQVSLCVLLKFMTTVNLLLVFATYWEHGTGHINAEHGREMVKSSLSLAVPSSDYVHMVKGKAIQQQWMATTHSLGLCSWCLQDSLAYFDHIGHRPPQFLRHEKTLDVEYELALICSPCRDQEYIWTCYGLLVLVWCSVLMRCKWPLWVWSIKQNVHFAFGCLSNH